MSEYRGEVRPRRTPSRHHIVMSSAAFGPLSNAQFPAMYTRNPLKNVYRNYMRSKTAYGKPRSA